MPPPPPLHLQFEILGESVGAEIFFLPSAGGYFFLPHVSIPKILKILWSIQKWVKNTEKILNPDLTPRSDLG